MFIVIGVLVLVVSFVVAVISLIKEQKAAEKSFAEKEKVAGGDVPEVVDSAFTHDEVPNTSLNAQAQDLPAVREETKTTSSEREPFPWEHTESRVSAIAELAAKVKEAETLQSQTTEEANSPQEPQMRLDGNMPAHMGEHEQISDVQVGDFSAPPTSRFARFKNEPEHEPKPETNFENNPSPVGVIDVQGLAKKNEG